jgi:hypothetical protein
MNIIYIIVILLAFLIIINYNKYNENLETNIISKSNDYIIVKTLAGLNNRIQVLLSYLYFAQSQGKKLKIVWITDEQCPDKFDNLFYPINNVEIIYDQIDESLIDYKHWNKQNNNYIKENYYSLLNPLITIQSDINTMKQLLSYDNKNYIACHIRRTDSLTHHWYSKYIKSDEEYIEFINKCPNNCNIYIATDCKITQQKFIELYGNRLKYKLILDTEELRQTSLHDAVKDMYVCAGAKYFMRSIGSFSDTIEHLRNIGNIENIENIGNIRNIRNIKNIKNIRNIGNEGYESDIKDNQSNYIIDGDEIYQPDLKIEDSEHSRFNYKTKECSHWYCLQIMNNILNNKYKKYNNVLVLGVALGSQIIHLLNKDSNIMITGVDIDDTNFNIVEKYSDCNRLTLIKDDANNYIINTNDTYDVIICDIFISKDIPEFVLTKEFLDKINKMLIHSKSKFILNTTYELDKDMIISLLKKSFINYKIDVINKPKFTNNIYFVTKN